MPSHFTSLISELQPTMLDTVLNSINLAHRSKDYLNKAIFPVRILGRKQLEADEN